MARPVNVPAGILFDLDDTIIDYRVAENACLEMARRETASRGGRASAERFQAALRAAERRFWSDLGWARSVAQGRSDIRC